MPYINVGSMLAGTTIRALCEACACERFCGLPHSYKDKHTKLVGLVGGKTVQFTCNQFIRR